MFTREHAGRLGKFKRERRSVTERKAESMGLELIKLTRLDAWRLGSYPGNEEVKSHRWKLVYCEGYWFGSYETLADVNAELQFEEIRRGKQ